jgi:arylsulfatase A-like enzyme
MTSLWLTLALAGCGESGGPGSARSSRAHGIVLIVLDTLRADALSAYGNPRPTTPTLDALAQRGVLFEQTVSHSPWTLPGFVGLLSGQFPSPRNFANGRLRVSMVEPIRAAGYATAAFTESGYVSKHFGMDRGFELFDERIANIRVPGAGDPKHRGGIERTFGAAIEWLRAHGEQPFFVLIHTYEPHLPYRRTDFAEALPSGALGKQYTVADAKAVRAGTLAAGETERDYVRALYEGGALASDRQVARLLQVLGESDLGLLDRTLIVVTSDHGEDLGARDPMDLGRHQHHLYDELLLVPLIISAPGRIWPTDRVKTQVRLVDVMPTVLDLAGVAQPSDADGRSLVPLMQGIGEAPRRAWVTLRGDSDQTVALRVNGRKLISHISSDAGEARRDEFYDLRTDPSERADLTGQGLESETRLKTLLDTHIGAMGGAGPAPGSAPCDADPALCEQLEALGYANP